VIRAIDGRLEQAAPARLGFQPGVRLHLHRQHRDAAALPDDIAIRVALRRGAPGHHEHGASDDLRPGPALADLAPHLLAAFLAFPDHAADQEMRQQQQQQDRRDRGEPQGAGMQRKRRGGRRVGHGSSFG